MRRIIFLDIDGVIATPNRIMPDGFWGLDDRCQDALGCILGRFKDAEIVISSSWRKADLTATVERLDEAGFRFCDRVKGQTIRAYNYIQPGIAMSIPRGVEIRQWIDHNVHSGGSGIYLPGANGTFKRKGLGTDYQYVIIDDDTDMLLEQADHFVRTESERGLTMAGAGMAESILLLQTTNLAP